MHRTGQRIDSHRTPRQGSGGPHFLPPLPKPFRDSPHRHGRLTVVGEWLRAFYLTRFSLLIVLALVLIGPIGTRWMPSMLGALFLISTPLQLLWVTVTSLLVAAMARVSWGVTLLNAPRRFHDCVHISRECLRWSPWDWIPTAAVGLLPPIYCFFATRADWLRAGHESFSSFAFLAAMGTGVVAVTLVLLVATVLQERLSGHEWESPGLLPFEWLPSMDRLRNRPTPSFVLNVEQPFARLLARLGPGYAREVHDPYTGQAMLRLGPGHFQSIVCTSVTLAAYILLGRLGRNLEIDQPWYPPAICFAMLTLLLLGWAMTALAYFLDRFRVPVLVTLLGITWFSYWGFGLDHYYEVTFDERAESTVATSLPSSSLEGDPRRPPRLEEIIHPGWQIPPGTDQKRTLVVVTASGGGIQASAWTAKVLCGLHERYPRHFAQSVGLISSVSGGSVGTMFYLVHLQSGRDPLDEDATTAVLTASRKSSIDAAAWGIAYPDFVRNVAPPLTELLYEKYTDRGRAIELAWNRFVTPSPTSVVGNTNAYLDQLVEPMKQHKLPVFVFNSVLVETGQRLLISPVCQEFGRAKASAEPQEFLDLYRGAKLSLATGARLSATFPFVSPICRPTPSPHIDEKYAYHVADGAYADNEGIVTAVDWMNQLCEFYSRPDNESTRPFDRVLFVRIQPFPIKKPKSAETGKGWKFATTGPLHGMLNVRQASQAERGNLEADLLAATRHLQNETRSLQFQSDQAQQLADRYAPKAEMRKLDATIAEQQAQMSLPPAMNKLPFRTAHPDSAHLHGKSLNHQGDPPQGGIEVDAVTITFPLLEIDEVLPLSWKLSEFDKQRIDKAWTKVLAQPASETNPIVKLDKYFPKSSSRIARRSGTNHSADTR
jgi:hypothetical protein